LIAVVVQRKFAPAPARHLTRRCRCKLPSSRRRCNKMLTGRTSEHNETNRPRQVPQTPRYAETRWLPRRASQFNDWQTFPPPTIAHIKANGNATVVGDRCVRRCAGCTARPSCSRFVSRTLNDGTKAQRTGSSLNNFQSLSTAVDTYAF
jgi:hypothetical protein